MRIEEDGTALLKSKYRASHYHKSFSIKSTCSRLEQFSLLLIVLSNFFLIGCKDFYLFDRFIWLYYGCIMGVFSCCNLLISILNAADVLDCGAVRERSPCNAWGPDPKRLWRAVVIHSKGQRCAPHHRKRNARPIASSWMVFRVHNVAARSVSD
jgi:hypothetical protein